MTRRGPGLRRHLLGIALFALVAVAVFVWFLDLSGVDLLPHTSYTVHAAAPDVVALSDHADVLEAGVKVGTVTGIDESRGVGELTLSLERRYGPVYRDGQIEIRAKTLAGEDYVALDPGSPAAGVLRSGGTLPRIAPEATQLDQILSTFDAPHRRDVQRLLDVLGAGLAGRGSALGGLLGGSADLVARATPVAAVLAADRAQVASLIDDFGTVAGSLGQRTAEIRRLVGAARTAATAVAGRDAALRAGLHALPGFLGQARRTVGHLGAFSLAATPVVHDLRLAAGALVPAVRVLGPAADAGRAVLARLPAFAAAARVTAARLHAAAPPLTGLLSPLQAVLRQANPLLSYLLPYSLDLATLFPSMDAPTHFRDGESGYARISVVFSDNLPAYSPQLQALIRALQARGLLPQLARKRYNAYPRPGQAVHPVPFTGRYPRVEPDPPYTLPARP